MNKIFMVSVAFVLFATGCKKDLDINKSPNNPAVEQGTPKLVFPAAVLSTAGRVGGDMAILGGLWSQYWTQSATANQYKNIDSYNLQSTDFNAAYTELFSGALNDYNFVIKKAKEQQDWSFYLMGTVMSVYTTQVLVDLYDKVPYSEAFQGATNLAPKFDDGYEIYKDLLARIDTALSKDLSLSTNSIPGTSDLVFGGDMDQWVRFANTLKLKMYLRMINAKPAEAEAGIKKMYTAGAEFLSDDAAVTSFVDQPDQGNPMFEYNIRRLNVTTNLRASNTLLSYLTQKGDTRLAKYYDKNTGINQGDYSSTDASYQTAGVVIQKATDPVYFISEAESYFLQAEALERYYSGTGAKALYDEGVKAAFAQYGLNGASFVASGGAYAYPTTGTLQQKIEAMITQKWISFFGSHALEAFFEKNRTDYPKTSPVYSTDGSYVPGQFVLSKNNVTGNKFPKRLVFPDVERSRNKNTPAEVPLTTAVWWSK